MVATLITKVLCARRLTVAYWAIKCVMANSARFYSAKKSAARFQGRLNGQQAYVCFYCAAIYHDLDEYNSHVESQHYHER
ncbi:hypothetical protein GGI18_000082 [Coemansia linderi]|uniref:Uncharacterized protein n=1 Tax=Coemansia linderi TaxID=2663919 RepID=A0ACC1KQK0_9FUNG|nr:hypothetical protein GGI18_000082 [Coemansia linderi]